MVLTATHAVATGVTQVMAFGFAMVVMLSSEWLNTKSHITLATQTTLITKAEKWYVNPTMVKFAPVRQILRGVLNSYKAYPIPTVINAGVMTPMVFGLKMVVVPGS